MLAIVIIRLLVMLKSIKINPKILIVELFLLIIVQGIYILQLNAQNNTSEFDSLNNIQVEKDIEFDFSNQNESISIQENIQKLDDYNISEPELQPREQEQEWGNTGDVKSHSVDFDIYNY